MCLLGKTANVIISETGGDMQGVVVDLHVARVAPHLGIASEDKAEKIEKNLMESVPAEQWRSLSLGLTYLGREIYRPTDPKCKEYVMNKWCAYYKNK